MAPSRHGSSVAALEMGAVALRPPDPLRPSGAKQKGFALLHFLQYVAETYGPETERAFVESIPPSVRDHVDRRILTSAGWVPLELYTAGILWLVEHRHGGDPRAGIDLGFDLATRDIGAFFRVIMGFASPARIIGLGSRFWRSYFDTSELLVLGSGEGTVSAEVRGWPFDAPASYYELAGSLLAWLVASRAKAASIEKLAVLAPGRLLMEARWT